MKRIIIILVTLMMLLAGCGQKAPAVTDRSDWSTITNDEQKKFDQWQRDWFVENSKSDYTTMRFNMYDPAAYGITEYDIDFGDLLIYDDTEFREKLEQLHQFDQTKLNKDQQLMYEMLEFELDTTIQKLNADKDWDFVFTPNGGINNNLITNLTEIDIRNEQDVKEFVELLKDVDRIIDEGIEYTKKQASNGYVQADAVLNSIMEQVERFLSAGENNEIIVAFHDKTADFDFDCSGYEKQVKDLVYNEVVPAYQRILRMLDSLKGKCTTNGTMYEYEGGKEYYNVMMQNRLGTDKDMSEIAKELYDALQDSFNRLYSVMNKMADESGYAPSDVYELMAKLQESSKADVPPLKELNYSINYLNPTVTSDNVAAYFITPPYDNPSRNIIKVNPTFVESNPDGLAATLAHEGYPGHMYQHAYYDQYHPNSELKRDISYLAYGEGWAQYAGLKSFEYFCKDKYFIEYSQAEEMFFYCTYAYSDLMMHYDGWTVDDVISLYGNYFNAGAAQSIGQSIYETNLGDPGVFVSYAWGMVKMVGYHEQAKKALGNKYSELELNRLILDVGNAPMFILDREVENYINSVK